MSETTSLRIDKATHQKLCDYADQRKSKSLDKAVESLLKQSEEVERLKSEIEKLNGELSKTKPQPITSDVPLGMPQNPEKQKALEQLKQEHYEVQELPIPPCNYCAKGRIDNKLGYQLIICNDPRKYKKPTEIALAACQNCWKRKEWAKEKREREQEENPQPEPEPQALELPNCSNLLKQGHNFPSGRTRPYPTIVTEIADKTVLPSIYCMQFGDWKTLDFCIDCFKGGKSTTIQRDVVEIEELGDVDA